MLERCCVHCGRPASHSACSASVWVGMLSPFQSHTAVSCDRLGDGGRMGIETGLLFSSVEIGRSGLLAWQINLVAQVEVHSLGKCFPLLHAPHRIFDVAACQCGFLLHHWSHVNV